jgi:hypothetical protein
LGDDESRAARGRLVQRDLELDSLDAEQVGEAGLVTAHLLEKRLGLLGVEEELDHLLVPGIQDAWKITDSTVPRGWPRKLGRRSSCAAVKSPGFLLAAARSGRDRIASPARGSCSDHCSRRA